MASPCKRSKSDLSSQILKNFGVALHPAALSKARKSILQRKIQELGGTVLEFSDDLSFPGFLVVLLDVANINTNQLPKIIEKLEELPHLSNVHVLDIKWLSSTIKTGELQDHDEFNLKEKKRERNEEETSKQEPKPLEANFACSQSSSALNLEMQDTNHDILLDELSTLAQTYRDMNDKWRAFGYEKAIAAIKKHPTRITNVTEASKIPNLGPKMAAKIAEILEHGSLQKRKEICDSEKAKVLNLFNRIWGVGPSTAELFYNQGHKTLEDLKSKANLTRQQQVGLELFDDLDQRMPREEASQIASVVEKVALSFRNDLDIVACGSYRRGKETCGDIDILISHPEEKEIPDFFQSLIDTLTTRESFLTHHLTFQSDRRQRKYLGVCKLEHIDSLHRRIDIIVVPSEQRAPAIVYFTGSAHFNRSMRLLAKKKGMSLSEHSLTKGSQIIPTPTEESVFTALGIPYRDPNERNH